jgi:centrosomal protein CEP70
MDTKAQREELRNEIQQLKQDLESRPTVKELKSYKEQLRCMDRLIQQSNMKWGKMTVILLGYDKHHSLTS